MLKRLQKILSILLGVMSAVTFLNVLVMSAVILLNVHIMNWFPVCLPLSFLTVERLTFIAFAMKQYALIPICVSICALLFYTALSVRRQHILCPILSAIYILCDLIVVVTLWIPEMGGWNLYARWYLFQALGDVTLIILICCYCWFCLRQKE